MPYTSNYRYTEIAGVNATSLTETQLVVDLSYKAAGYRGLLLSEAPLKEFPTTPITVLVGATAYTEVDITAGYPSGTNFCVEYSSNSGVIYLPTAVALGTSCTITYRATGTVASIESKQYNLDGTVGAPGISFANDPGSGRYLIAANQIGESIGGVKVSEINTLGVLNGIIGTDNRNLLQVKTIKTSSLITGTTTVPFDNTIPQITEGILILSLNFTPLRNNSTLEISYQTIISGNTIAARITNSIFRVGTNDSLGSVYNFVGFGQSSIIGSTILVPSVNTLLQTFQMRAGGNQNQTYTINGENSTAYYGGSLNSYILIKEFA